MDINTLASEIAEKIGAPEDIAKQADNTMRLAGTVICAMPAELTDDMKAAIADFRLFLVEAHGGYSETQGNGAWKDDAGNLVFEDNITWRVSMVPSDPFCTMVLQSKINALGVALGQEWVHFEISPASAMHVHVNPEAPVIHVVHTEDLENFDPTGQPFEISAGEVDSVTTLDQPDDTPMPDGIENLVEAEASRDTSEDDTDNGFAPEDVGGIR